MTEQTFVYGEIEVRKTGRQAEKSTGRIGGQKIILVEITPLNPDDGTWKKWVNPNALFRITPEES